MKTEEFSVDPRAGNCLEMTLDLLDKYGFCVLDRILEEGFCADTELAMARVNEQVLVELKESGRFDEHEEIVMPYNPFLLQYDPHFVRFLELELVHKIVAGWLGPDAILRYQLGQYSQPQLMENPDRARYKNYHRQFRHIENVRGLCIELIFFLQELNAENGAVYVIPGSHNLKETPEPQALAEQEMIVTARAGSVLLLEGMTWHREDENRGRQALPILSHQFVKPIIKQYVDYPRVLPAVLAEQISPAARKLLGYNSRVPASLEEFCRPLGKRTYQESSPGSTASMIPQSPEPST